MKIRDLGELSGQVLVFGGPYSNLQATQALIAEARARGITAQNCICTGDVVAYCADAAATLAEIRAFGCSVVAGNMEINLGAGATDCGCGFDEGTPCDLMSDAWFAHATGQMSVQDRAWMASCPDCIVFAHAGKRYAVVHGAPRDASRFVWPTTPVATFAAEFDHLRAVAGPVDAILAGHSGIEFVRDFSFGQWINAGVIGMPPHDGASDTRYALLQNGAVHFQPLSYDFATASERMTKAGLTQGYHTALVSGYWPSEDVLPSEFKVPSCASG